MEQAARGIDDQNEDTAGLAELARLRQAGYRLLSQSLLYPDGPRVQAIAATARELAQESDRWAAVAPFPEWARLLDALDRFGDQDTVVVQGEYVSRFLVNRAGIPAPIYESAYERAEATGWVLAQLETEYAHQGLVPSPELREPPDHVAVELEFMSFLCSHEAQAWEEDAPSEAARALRTQRSFLKRHLARWLPEFAGRLGDVERDSVFTTIAEAALAFVARDGSLVTALLHQFGTVAEVEAR